jgi:hypothetical protein
MTQLQELSTAIDQFKKEQNALKQQFIKTIKDKSIPVDERWEFWCDAPSSLKDFSQFSVKFESMGRNFHWTHDMWFERYQTVDLEDVVLELENSVQVQVDDLEQQFHRKLFRHPELLDQLKEEILARNLEYFVFDW